MARFRFVFSTLAFLVFTGLSAPVLATTWAFIETDDPFSSAKCNVAEPASYGSYIYWWESKYDLIYWPYTEELWVWHCSESGFVSFGDDFDELTKREKEKIRPALEKMQRTQKVETIEDKLVRMEAIYELRNKDNEFWAWFYRVMAYWRDGDNNELALEYRKKALVLIETLILKTPDSYKLIEYTYLLGEYNRQLGNLSEAEKYFDQARKIEWVNDEGESQKGSPYINELIDERSKLMKEN